MHALMTTVLFGVWRIGVNGHNSQFNKPVREPGKSLYSLYRSKGTTIISMDLFRNAILPENPCELCFCWSQVFFVMTFGSEHKSAFWVSYGEWMTVYFITHQKLAFVVRTPDFIAMLRVENGVYGFDSSQAFLWAYQTMFFQDVVYGQHTWDLVIWKIVIQQLVDLFCAPQLVFFFQSEDTFYHFFIGGIRMGSARFSRQFSQAFVAFLFKSSDDFISCWPGDFKDPTQLRDAVFSRTPFTDKLNFLFHYRCFFPRHGNLNFAPNCDLKSVNDVYITL